MDIEKIKPRIKALGDAFMSMALCGVQTHHFLFNTLTVLVPITSLLLTQQKSTILFFELLLKNNLTAC
jgi:hypothetical protein